ncbi:26S proteasome regulatory complex [Volvox carteri f. nagariensis]|uniref:26S proteasome regulatory complex n=1 Tax=Volvox carteri f. nagariensis TaxID=3068 RepID=D8UA39_VOLCA|nr:26S proteasome regulatory complex [Volvox carteri f. nagariensis]EFJ43408.1 26S proteasome regulatory complex [Volvox carteri f. nagariensis]|eukprot:XP_002955555.1 26S proteasome regulatory complex [Volvox carteri f. nagariensis]
MPAGPEKVVLHPLVLLSVVDHYSRVAKDTKKRVVGVLLGELYKGTVDVTNSFALPFEEDDHDPSIWFLDHSYLEQMYKMFKKVNAREKIVGWYSTGPKLREADLDINELIRQFCDHPVLVICEVQPKEVGLPFTAYHSVDEVRTDGTEKAKKVFNSLPTQVGQTEAEEIGVEHLLRDVKDATLSSLAGDVSSKLLALKGLQSRLAEISEYLGLVIDGKLPVNHDIINLVQEIFNLLPNMNVESLSKSLAVKSNDMMHVIYIASLVRSILALHKLIDNKEQRLWQEREAAKKEKEKAEEKAKKEKDSKEAKDGGSGKEGEAAKDGSSKGAEAIGKK